MKYFSKFRAIFSNFWESQKKNVGGIKKTILGPVLNEIEFS